MKNTLNLNILECRRFVAPSAKTIIRRVVKDYEFDYNLHGTRTLWVDGTPYELNDGDVAFRIPGQEVYSIGDYDCYVLTVDFSGKTSGRQYSRNVPGPIQVRSESQLLAAFEPVMTGAHTTEIRACFASLARQADMNCAAGQAIFMELLYLLNADCARKMVRKSAPIVTPAEEVLQYLRENLAEQITLEMLAKKVHLDPSYLVRLFRQRFGQTPVACLIALRMSRARELLLSTDMTIGEISAACGYRAPSYFVTQYKQHFHITPGAQRRNALGNRVQKLAENEKEN